MDELSRDAERFGYTPEAIEKIKARHVKDADGIEVMEDCWDAVQVFSLCEWQRVGLSGLKEARVYVTHIEAVEIECVARGMEVPFNAELIAQVRYMESIARPLKNAK